MTEFSGGYGDKWKGNSILLRIENENKFKYVHIGTDIFEFLTDEKIIKYVSSVGNNCVPYPYAESENWCYCMLERNKTPVKDHPKRKSAGNISYSKKARYYPFDMLIISGRGTNNIRYPASCREETNMVKFSTPGTFRMMKNTNNNKKLPAVRHFRNILHNDHKQKRECIIF